MKTPSNTIVPKSDFLRDLSVWLWSTAAAAGVVFAIVGIVSLAS